MPQHEAKTCPRCNQLFVCKAGDIANCQCNGIHLNIEESAFIEERYTDCICANCLTELKYRYTLFKEKYLFNSR